MMDVNDSVIMNLITSGAIDKKCMSFVNGGVNTYGFMEILRCLEAICQQRICTANAYDPEDGAGYAKCWEKISKHLKVCVKSA